jgi:hypothetical protein
MPPLSRLRIVGIALIVVGVVATAIVGLYLATAAGAGMTLQNVLANGFAAFVGIAVVVGLGLYFYARATLDNINASPTDALSMRKQRQLIDLLRSEAREFSIAEVQRTLVIEEADLRGLLDELNTLHLFSGYVDWAGERLRAVDTPDLQAARACLRCGAPIQINAHTTCAKCGTQYNIVT